MNHSATAVNLPFEDSATTGDIMATSPGSTTGTYAAPEIVVLPSFVPAGQDWVADETDLELPLCVAEEDDWFFTQTSQLEEAEADRDIDQGRVARFSNVEDLIGDLRS